ncbi:serine hydrolase domain-containing protein [Lederbergia wuyishanensis]|uniref:CubicO group peptidase (Beta-lactamase class C family) n=1 Tax=Lederbergia wuyishanensis TaxID=1347903 RepID=A0ABU0D3S1_9BACI|nr:serine hydrolase domain-containing protein [Lederbergia wuyishanensis]MCJ8007788.1 beta-lactamase family protein [Lederbergia wuyishanensis]MDQ0343049.1 CubicO group peptidase (beta-lactamase class C family) [Lederbergia wuyishanensis]
MKEKVISFLQKEIDLENIPGAAIYISHNGSPILEEAIGYRTLAPIKKPMQLDTVFDLASLTKIVTTMIASLQLLDRGEIRLDDSISHFFPSFSENGKEEVRIRHLLTHTSGLPAHRRFYEGGLNTEQVIGKICAEKLENPVGQKVVYSDLGFILLASLIEKLVGVSFADYVNREILSPLEMHETGFNLPFERERFAATEFSEKINDFKCGIVHDDNAESMGGVSGHAGLFSTLKDLANFAHMIENGGNFKGKKIISTVALELSRRNFTPFDEEGRGLGWQINSPRLSCGDLFSNSSYGHTGFTGTSMWFDPEIKLHVILLTNRVHAKNQQAILRLRPRLHNLIRAEI